MKRLIGPAIVIATAVLVAVLVLRAEPQSAALSRPQLEVLMARCDPGGSSLATMYAKVAARMPEDVTHDPKTALAAVRGQISNVVDGRLGACEQALAVAQHDRRGSAVTALSAVVEHLMLAHTALRDLVTVLESGSGDAAAKLSALSDAVHAASR